MIKKFLTEINGINLIDIGSSGSLDEKWQHINKHINLIGFDPNAEECLRMEALPHNFKSVKYLPYAVGGQKEIATLHKTKSIYCYSLLEPNTEWLNRFSFYELFEKTGEEPIETVILGDIDTIKQKDIDIIKCDTQGLEFPILNNSGQALEQAFMVETETGFVENYIGETTYSQIDQFMRSQGFLLFDINTSHRIPRNNIFKTEATGAEQLLWCEAVWLKDYVSLIKKGKLKTSDLSREKILKALIICSIQGCIDYGYELAVLAHELKFLTADELSLLKNKEAWEIQKTAIVKNNSSMVNKLINLTLRLLPGKLRVLVKEEAAISIHQKHLLK